MKLRSILGSKGFSHVEMLIVAVVVVVVAAAGFFVYNHDKTNVAHAAGYTRLGTWNSISVYACKTYTPSFGGVYQITVLYTKAASTYPTPYNLYTYQGSKQITHQQSSSYWANTVGTLHANLSIPLGQSFSAGTLYGGENPGSYLPNLANC